MSDEFDKPNFREWSKLLDTRLGHEATKALLNHLTFDGEISCVTRAAAEGGFRLSTSITAGRSDANKIALAIVVLAEPPSDGNGGGDGDSGGTPSRMPQEAATL